MRVLTTDTTVTVDPFPSPSSLQAVALPQPPDPFETHCHRYVDRSQGQSAPRLPNIVRLVPAIQRSETARPP